MNMMEYAAALNAGDSIDDLRAQRDEAEHRVCDGCGYSYSAKWLKEHGKLSCCPERKMLTAKEWATRANAAERERDEAILAGKNAEDAFCREITELFQEIAKLSCERDALRERIGDAPNDPEVFDRIRELTRERDGYMRAKDTWKGLQAGTSQALAQVEADRNALRERLAALEYDIPNKWQAVQDELRERLAEAETALRSAAECSTPYMARQWAAAYFAKHGAPV